MSKSLLAALALGAIGTRPCAALDLYVDALNGNDATGDGSALAPYRTLTHAATLPSYADVWIAPGIYDAANGEVFPIYYRGGPISLHGSRSAPSILRSGGLDALRFGIPYGVWASMEDLVFEGAPVSSTPSGVGVWGADSLLTVSRCQLSGFAIALKQTVIDDGPQVVASRLSLSRSVLADNGTAVVAHATVWASLAILEIDMDSSLFLRNGVALDLTADCQNCSGEGVYADVVNNTFVGGAGDAIHAAPIDPLATFAVGVGSNIFASQGGLGVNALSPGVTVGGNDFWQNAGGDWSPAVVALPNNLLADPLFADPVSDFHLTPGSPCIDAGDESAPGPDLDGGPRPIDGDGDSIARTDIGAYEYDTGMHLRRADFSSVEPLQPAKAGAFPFDGRNPATPVVNPAFLSGATDPSKPPIFRDLSRPLAFYRSSRSPRGSCSR